MAPNFLQELRIKLLEETIDQFLTLITLHGAGVCQSVIRDSTGRLFLCAGNATRYLETTALVLVNPGP